MNTAPKMSLACPDCGEFLSKVIETRAVRKVVRRRRECDHCGRRFTTDEVIRPDTKRKYLPGRYI